MKKNKFILIIIFICSQFLVSTIAFGNILKIGNDSAKVTVKVFSSLTCPHCASFHNCLCRYSQHLKIYDKQKRWAVGSDINKINDILVKIGTDSKINESNLRACLKNEETQELILNERIKAQKEYNITSTPTIYINDKKYEDKHEFKSFKRQIDKLLQFHEV